MLENVITQWPGNAGCESAASVMYMKARWWVQTWDMKPCLIALMSHTAACFSDMYRMWGCVRHKGCVCMWVCVYACTCVFGRTKMFWEFRFPLVCSNMAACLCLNMRPERSSSLMFLLKGRRFDEMLHVRLICKVDEFCAFIWECFFTACAGHGELQCNWPGAGVAKW